MFLISKGSIGHAFTVRIRTENQNQASFSPFGPREISVLTELTLGHLRYRLTDVPPQPNSPPDLVSRTGGHDVSREVSLKAPMLWNAQSNGISKATLRVVVFQSRASSHLCYTP